MGYWKPQQQPTFHLGHCPGCQQLRTAQSKPAVCRALGGGGVQADLKSRKVPQPPGTVARICTKSFETKETFSHEI